MKSANRINRVWVITIAILALTVVTCAAGPAFGRTSETGDKAKTPGQPRWVYPAIAKFGGVHPRPNVPVRPDPSANYKIFVDVVSKDRDPAGHYDGLLRLARLVNLMAYAKVPSKHVHIVALLDGEAGWAAAVNAAYQKRFNADNPNLPIIHALRKAGVELLICSQALAEHNLPDSIVDPDVTITLSALTDAVVYGEKGYIYMQL